MSCHVVMLADSQGAHGCQGEEGLQSVVGLWCDMGLETQGGPLVLHLLSFGCPPLLQTYFGGPAV